MPPPCGVGERGGENGVDGHKLPVVGNSMLIHDWGLFNPIATLPEVRTAITQVASELQKPLK